MSTPPDNTMNITEDLVELVSCLLDDMNRGTQCLDINFVQERYKLLVELVGAEMATELVKQFGRTFTYPPIRVGKQIE